MTQKRLGAEQIVMACLIFCTRRSQPKELKSHDAKPLGRIMWLYSLVPCRGRGFWRDNATSNLTLPP